MSSNLHQQVHTQFSRENLYFLVSILLWTPGTFGNILDEKRPYQEKAHLEDLCNNLVSRGCTGRTYKLHGGHFLAHKPIWCLARVLNLLRRKLLEILNENKNLFFLCSVIKHSYKGRYNCCCQIVARACTAWIHHQSTTSAWKRDGRTELYNALPYGFRGDPQHLADNI